MHSFFHEYHDLVSPDGYLCSSLQQIAPSVYEGEVEILNIPPYFLGFYLPKECVHINIKSSLAQLGVDARLVDYDLDLPTGRARLFVHFLSHDPIATEMLNQLKPGHFVAKLFAADDRRLVRSTEYLERMLKQVDQAGDPLLCFGKQLEHLISFDVVDDRLIVSLPSLPGTVYYDPAIYGLLPLFSKALSNKKIKVRSLLSLYQHVVACEKLPIKNHILLVKTEPLHIRTVFARVVNEQLPTGLRHTSADILEPTTKESGDIYEFFGTAKTPVEKIPLEFFTIEPYKEHSFFYYRDTLQASLDSEDGLCHIFDSAPKNKEKVATYISKGSEIANLSEDSWLSSPHLTSSFDEEIGSSNIQQYIESQPAYPLLHAMETGLITSEGALFSRYFPSFNLKGMLLSFHVRHYLKQIYFEIPSYSYGQFFSKQDRSLLLDLFFANILVFWVDTQQRQILQYVKRTGHDTGMFVPKKQVQAFRSAYFIGIHGSCILAKAFDQEIKAFLKGINNLTRQKTIPGFAPMAPLAIITGGGAGAMAMGNQIASELGLLSCANIIDFEHAYRDQPVNPFVQAKMTYRLSCLIERQDDFHVDLALFVVGGIGTDFELMLELVSIKTGKKPPVPVFLFGPAKYWKEKISHTYQINVQSGTLQDAEWVSNCVYCIETPEAGIRIFEQYLDQTLPIGPEHPPHPHGFAVAS